MKEFDWTQFSKRVFINAELKLVYNAWTKSEELEKWFLSNATFQTKEGTEILPSDNVNSESIYSWNWFAQNHFEKGIINQANGIDLIEFTFAGNCIVQVRLSKAKNKTLVELTQTEIPLDDSSKKNIRLGCAFGWTFYLLNLKSVLEGGLDLRNKDAELIGVINN
ncbi:MAG: SRPBCC domain-containing protein [Flavobacteriales bacterium]|nr:SRPBCC domain-containing protein [Flavobacteriales bacterium]NQX96745.1 SRPBCC domain-containing protein [Flavobacteriales bacterium]